MYIYILWMDGREDHGNEDNLYKIVIKETNNPGKDFISFSQKIYICKYGPNSFSCHLSYSNSL